MPKTIHLSLPAEVEGTPFEKDYRETAQRVLAEQTVLRLYREHKISTGTGAKLLGLSRYDFIQFLGEHQVSVFSQNEDSLLAEVTAGAAAIAAKPPRKGKRP